jgi:hypothetical protein
MLHKSILTLFVGIYAAAVASVQTEATALELAATGDPFVFAMMLADASVPSGIVLAEPAIPRIVFDGTEHRVIDGLNAIARQAKTTWLVVTTDTEKEPKLLKVGFIHRGGSTTLVDVKTGLD